MSTRRTLLVLVTALVTVLNVMIYLSSSESHIVEIEQEQEQPVRMHHAIYRYEIVVDDKVDSIIT